MVIRKGKEKYNKFKSFKSKILLLKKVAGIPVFSAENTD